MKKLLPYAIYACIALIAWLSYAPGLRGGFLFDDFANLPTLGATGPIDKSAAFWRYLTSGTADPTGRPVALLSFLIDAQNWPANPAPFLRTNVLLHLFNGFLLLQLLLQLSAIRGHQGRRTDLASSLAAGLWLTHPLFVSTTLYIVQREAMLAATFVLLGLLLWLLGRKAMHNNQTVRAYFGTFLGLVVCTGLATLCKANGILLPAFCVVIEYSFLRTTRPFDTFSWRSSQIRRYKRIFVLLAVLPSTAIAGALLYAGIDGVARGITSLRTWTLGQRLLTEPRVIWEYLGILWTPRSFSPGLFNDNIVVSTSLWSPPTTALAIFGLTALITGAVVLRRKYPAISFTILFYLVGQSIESTSIPLELYFEHRNYLPAMIMFWPLSMWLAGVPVRNTVDETKLNSAPSNAATSTHQLEQQKKLLLLGKGFVSLALLAVLCQMTHSSASIWGNPRQQALVWAWIAPDSPRAQANAAQAEMSEGHYGLAIERLQRALKKKPGEVQLSLNLFVAQCQTGHVDQETLDVAQYALEHTRDPGTLLVSWFERLIQDAPKPICPEASIPTLSSLLQATLKNEHITAMPGRLQDIYYLQGRLALVEGQGHEALQLFNRALDQQVRVELALQQAAILGAAGKPELGIEHLDYFEIRRQQLTLPSFGMPRLHQWVLDRQGYWQSELARLRHTLEEDRASKI